MARYSEKDPVNIYAAGERFLNNCLLSDGSLVFDGEALWRLELLQDLHARFVQKADTGNRSFMVKLHDQIVNANADVIRLASELLSVYFLFPSNVSGRKKREVVNLAMSWANTRLPPESLVSQAFTTGIGSAGQGYNTRRFVEISFLIEFVLKWKRLSAEERQRNAADPWRFEQFIDGVADDASAKQLRNILLHLVFPDAFERIASKGHKRRIVNAFAGLAGNAGDDDPGSDDRKLFRIRTQLEQFVSNRPLDFYLPPLRGAWYDGSEGESEQVPPLEAIRHKRQVVLYGPPGTGKTYQAKGLAARIIRGAALKQMGAGRYFRSQDVVDAAVTSNVHRLQLHPTYSYEDFIRGLHIAENGATEYRKGYLLRLLDTMAKQPESERLPHVLILDEMNRTDMSRTLGECFSLLEDREESIELAAPDRNGAPFVLRIPKDLFVIGTMNLIDQSVEQIDFALRRRFLWWPCPFDPVAFVSVAKVKWENLDNRIAWDRVEDDFQRLANAAEALNKQIHDSELLGPQYEIGHTYFLDVIASLNDSLDGPSGNLRLFLWGTSNDAKAPVKQIWEWSLRPLLEQYLAGLDAKTRNAELERLGKVLLKAAPLVD